MFFYLFFIFIHTTCGRSVTRHHLLFVGHPNIALFFIKCHDDFMVQVVPHADELHGEWVVHVVGLGAKVGSTIVGERHSWKTGHQVEFAIRLGLVFARGH